MQVELERSEVYSLIAAIRDRTTAIEVEVNRPDSQLRPSSAAVELATLKRSEDKLRAALEAAG